MGSFICVKSVTCRRLCKVVCKSEFSVSKATALGPSTCVLGNNLPFALWPFCDPGKGPSRSPAESCAPATGAPELSTRELSPGGEPAGHGWWPRGRGRPGARPVTYLVRLDRARGHLLNDQGPLQLGAQRGAVVSAAALPGRSAKRNKGRVAGAETGAALRGLGMSPPRTCRARPEPSVPTPLPWPRASVSGGERSERGRRSRPPPAPPRVTGRAQGRRATGLGAGAPSGPRQAGQPVPRSPPGGAFREGGGKKG